MPSHPELFNPQPDLLGMTVAQRVERQHRDGACPTAPHASTDVVRIDGGTFTMGSDHHYPEEAPAHEVSVDGCWIDPYPVTNEKFSRFVHETGYVTLAERAPKVEDYPGANPELLVPASV